MWSPHRSRWGVKDPKHFSNCLEEGKESRAGVRRIGNPRLVLRGLIVKQSPLLSMVYHRPSRGTYFVWMGETILSSRLRAGVVFLFSLCQASNASCATGIEVNAVAASIVEERSRY